MRIPRLPWRTPSSAVGHGEIGIKFDGLSENEGWRRRHRGGVSLAWPSAVFLEGFERGSGGLFERRGELLDGSERFAEFLAKSEAARSMPFRTCSLLSTSTCSVAMASPVWPLMAFQLHDVVSSRVAAMEPVIMALMLSRWQISRPTVGGDAFVWRVGPCTAGLAEFWIPGRC